MRKKTWTKNFNNNVKSNETTIDSTVDILHFDWQRRNQSVVHATWASPTNTSLVQRANEHLFRIVKEAKESQEKYCSYVFIILYRLLRSFNTYNVYILHVFVHFVNTLLKIATNSFDALSLYLPLFVYLSRSLSVSRSITNYCKVSRDVWNDGTKVQNSLCLAIENERKMRCQSKEKYAHYLVEFMFSCNVIDCQTLGSLFMCMFANSSHCTLNDGVFVVRLHSVRYDARGAFQPNK